MTAKQAVALKYQPETDTAPKVVAKGERKLAEQIVALGREHGVPVVEDELLARLLFPLVPGQAIPEELYEPVAKILAYVAKFYYREGIG